MKLRIEKIDIDLLKNFLWFFLWLSIVLLVLAIAQMVMS